MLFIQRFSDVLLIVNGEVFRPILDTADQSAITPKLFLAFGAGLVTKVLSGLLQGIFQDLGNRFGP